MMLAPIPGLARGFKIWQVTAIPPHSGCVAHNRSPTPLAYRVKQSVNRVSNKLRLFLACGLNKGAESCSLFFR